MANKFRKNDKVIVLAGASKGVTGKILLIRGSKAIVENANIATIHKKPTQAESGSIIKKEKPIHLSNLSHVLEGKPVKIKFITDDKKDGTKFSKKFRQDKKGNNIDN